MINEERLRKVLHDIVEELIDSLQVPHIHNERQVQNMATRVHQRIEGLTDLR